MTGIESLAIWLLQLAGRPLWPYTICRSLDNEGALVSFGGKALDPDAAWNMQDAVLRRPLVLRPRATWRVQDLQGKAFGSMRL